MNKTKILYIIDRADRWYVDDDGGFIACEDDDDIEHTVSAKDLKKIHEDLPAALTGLIDWSLAKRIKGFGKMRRTPDYELAYAERDLIESTIELLESGGFRFTDPANNHILLSKITDIHLTSEDPEYLPMDGFVVEVNHVCQGEKRIPFVVKSHLTQVVIGTDCVEKDYPGALKRLLIGQDLGIEHDALIRHVFSTLHPAQETTLMDKVNFE